METTIEKTTEALNDLIIINNDRYEGYQKAMDQAKEADLKSLFSTFSNQSKSNNSVLRSLVPTEEAPARDETRLSGKFYRAWMDVKNAIDAGDRKKILSSCEYGEDVAKKAYENVLEDKSNLTPEAAATIKNQYDEILKAHNQVKALRDNA
ncbi:PA2169 family four-helix-bundle protein [Hanamia caeni]|uniref:PA2169 family four-helix-bundle protein n=1 Tax=Hanamia caeni TaxID=2294116 RepID=A0A3M9N9M8_9BACT|nr:PA2169 family four-helix-bundle protein [Hanamia caeni]RNI34499.1 PA2169 family four-helix-bundle protein [Hanamia caeni]